MQVELVPISKVKENPDNPRVIRNDKFKKLVKSIQEFPEMLKIRPIVVNSEMVVLGGNMRLKACKDAGLKEVYIYNASELTKDQQKEFIIKDNVGFGEWDWDVLANQWDELPLQDWGLDIPFEPVIDDLGEAEENDISDSIKNMFRIEIICKDEEEQEKSYNKLIELGYECRLLTL